MNEIHQEEVEGEPEDDEERPLTLHDIIESLPLVSKDLTSLRETEQASASIEGYH